MPLTLEQIVEETSHWALEKLGEPIKRFTEGLQASDRETEAAWKNETDRRAQRP